MHRLYETGRRRPRRLWFRTRAWRGRSEEHQRCLARDRRRAVTDSSTGRLSTGSSESYQRQSSPSAPSPPSTLYLRRPPPLPPSHPPLSATPPHHTHYGQNQEKDRRRGRQWKFRPCTALTHACIGQLACPNYKIRKISTLYSTDPRTQKRGVFFFFFFFPFPLSSFPLINGQKPA